MKKQFLLYLALLCTPWLYAADITLNGVAYRMDTIKQFVAGPGCDYWSTRMTRLSDGKGRLDAYFLRVDMKNPYISLEHVMAKDMLISTERPSSMMTRKTTPTHVVVGGTNGDFYKTTGDIGCPTGPSVINGEMLYVGYFSRGLGAINKDGMGVFATVKGWDWDGHLNVADTSITIADINWPERKNNQLILYSHWVSSTRMNDDGTEVLVKLKEGETWKTTGNMKFVVLDVFKGKGDTPMQKGEYVLSGHGTKAAVLNTLQIGDEVSIDLELTVNGKPEELVQCIGADWYTQILADGEFFADSLYWNSLEPRTGFGATKEGDVLLFCVVDGRGNSAGCTTKVLGEIMKHNGAWNAINWDGGGSSCMTLNHFGQVNDPADASGERAVCDAMFAVANVPTDDQTIASIRPHDYKYALPYYGMYAPKFYGYNQYGLMVDTDVQGVVLSCDESLGHIQEDGSFIASGTQSGQLHAALGELTTIIEIAVNMEAKISFRLDSILVDNRKPYVVEVTSFVNGNIVNLPAHALEWTTEDAQVCQVSTSGEVLGISNGVTNVIGAFGSFLDTLKVYVELPPCAEYVWEDFVEETDTWNISATSGFNPIFVAPTEDAPQATLQFTYKTGRKPFILLEKDIPLYGLPDSIRLIFNTDAIFTDVVLGVRANNQAVSQFMNHKFSPIPTNKDTTFTISTKDLLEGTDPALYPVWMKSLRFNVSTSTTAGEHKIVWKGIVLHYSGLEIETALDQAVLPAWTLYPNPVADGVLQVTNLTAGSSLVLCDIQGRELVRKQIGGEQIQLDMHAYPAGQYLLTVDNQTVKIIKK